MNERLPRFRLRVFTMSYQLLNKWFFFKMSAQRAHERIIELLRFSEKFPLTVIAARFLHRIAFRDNPIDVGGVLLPHPLILAAGFVKGDGFKNEDDALHAVNQEKRNIIPGWRVIPALVGPVEFGSFTRHPRSGNPGTVIWRHIETRSTQNRVGLKNPGARAAASFLGKNREYLPDVFGINIAVSPGVTDILHQERELIEALQFFIDEAVIPAWFTLNLSCPNTEDDPLGHQLESETRQLCHAFINHLRSQNFDAPLWVKISPDLAPEQYHMLIRIADEVGVRAIIATNTLAQPTPDDPTVTAGVGGGALFEEAIMAITHLRLEKARLNYTVDLIGCGGIIDGATYHDYRTLGVNAVQYWSAIVYRGPLAAAIIESELSEYEREFEPHHSESLASH